MPTSIIAILGCESYDLTIYDGMRITGSLNRFPVADFSRSKSFPYKHFTPPTKRKRGNFGGGGSTGPGHGVRKGRGDAFGAAELPEGRADSGVADEFDGAGNIAAGVDDEGGVAGALCLVVGGG